MAQNTATDIRSAASATFAGSVMAEGDIGFDRTRKAIRVGDGATAGGIVIRGPIGDLRDYNGLDLTGSNDNASLVQTAFNSAIAQGFEVHVPMGKIALGSTVNVTGPLSVGGEGHAQGRPYTTPAVIGPASRFHFAHSGIGFQVGTGSFFDGVRFSDIMTSRDQPAVVSGQAWTPNDHDYDFVQFAMASLTIENCLLLNPTRGINASGGGGIGRLNVYRTGMHAMKTGINIELMADIPRLQQLQFWPWWSDTYEVNGWCLNNADSIHLKRADTPMLIDVFAIAMRSLIRVSTGQYGGPTLLEAVNAHADGCKWPFWWDSTSNNMSGMFTNVGAGVAEETSVRPAALDGVPILVEGNGNFLDFTNVVFNGAPRSLIKVNDGAVGNDINVSGKAWALTYGRVANEPAVYIPANNRIHFSSEIRNSRFGAGNGPLFAGAGWISAVEWRAYAPVVSAASGALGTGNGGTVAAGRFRFWNRVVDAHVDITVNDKGTASQSIIGTLPYQGPASGTFANGHGRCTAVSPLGLSVLVSNGQFEILANDGSFPVPANGTRLSVQFSYNL